MKRLKFIVFFLLAALLTFPINTSANGETVETEYAYLSRETMMYGISGTGLYEMVALPRTYFVALISPASLPDTTPPESSVPDITEGYYLVNYLNLTGYVKKSDVEIVDYEPVTKYASVSLSPDNDGLGANLREKPKKDSSVLMSIPAGEVIAYYGTLSGDAILSQLGSKWYYVKYAHNGLVSYGYVYSGHVKADEIPPNKIEKVEKPKTDEPTPAPVTIPQSAAIILIIALSLPAGIVMLLLFKKKPEDKTPRNSDKNF